MLTEEARQFLSVPGRHPWAFVAAYVPVVAAVVFASVIYKFTFAFCLPLLWCFFVSIFLIQGIMTGQLTDNHGTAIRHQAPIRFWGKVGVWSAFYLLAIAWCLGFAWQERGNAKADPEPGAHGSPSVRWHADPPIPFS